MSKWSNTYIYALHRPQQKHLAIVTEEMRVLGPPTIRALWAGDHWRAIEGSHRLAAARSLELTPVIEEVFDDDVVEHDAQDLPSPAKVSDILDTPELGPDYRFANIKEG